MALAQLTQQQARPLQSSSVAQMQEIERRQHVQELCQRVLSACSTEGFRAVNGCIQDGLQHPQALTSALDQTYSQVLDVVLCSLERQLLGAGSKRTILSSTGGVSDGPGAAGYAPNHASAHEIHAALRVLQGLCILHEKSHLVMGSSNYLHLISAKAFESAAFLPACLDTLLSILAHNEHAQTAFIKSGTLARLAALTQDQTAAEGTKTACNQFLQVLLGTVLEANDSTLDSPAGMAQQVIKSVLGNRALEQLRQPLPALASASSNAAAKLKDDSK